MKSLFLVCIFPLLILANPKVRLPDLLNDVVAVDPPEIKPLGQWFLTINLFTKYLKIRPKYEEDRSKV